MGQKYRVPKTAYWLKDKTATCGPTAFLFKASHLPNQRVAMLLGIWILSATLCLYGLFGLMFHEELKQPTSSCNDHIVLNHPPKYIQHPGGLMPSVNTSQIGIVFLRGVGRYKVNEISQTNTTDSAGSVSYALFLRQFCQQVPFSKRSPAKGFVPTELRRFEVPFEAPKKTIGWICLRPPTPKKKSILVRPKIKHHSKSKQTLGKIPRKKKKKQGKPSKNPRKVHTEQTILTKNRQKKKEKCQKNKQTSGKPQKNRKY